MTLQPNFLPVGSIISQNNTPLIVMGLIPPEPRIEERFNHKWIVSTCGFNVPLDDCKPIPLTQEILTDWCGFVPRSDHANPIFDLIDEVNKKSMSIGKLYNNKWRVLTIVGSEYEFLHQIQLAYSALTQTVLPITIK